MRSCGIVTVPHSPASATPRSSASDQLALEVGAALDRLARPDAHPAAHEAAVVVGFVSGRSGPGEDTSTV